MDSDIWPERSMMDRVFQKLLAGAAVAALLFTAGCGDKKTDTADRGTKPAVTEQKEAKQEAVKKEAVRPVPKSPLYEYALFLDDVDKVPPMTDEILGEFKRQAQGVPLAPKDEKLGTEGKFVFNSAVAKGADIYTYQFVGKLPGHHARSFIVDGKTVEEQHSYHITMTADAKTRKMDSVRVYQYDVSPESPKGQIKNIYEKKF